MNSDRYAIACQYACQFQQLILVRMYSAGRQQPQQVGRATAFRQRCDEVVQGCVAGQQTVFYCRIDAPNILADDPSGPQVHVADFGVSHLAGGKANVDTAGVDKGVRPGSPQSLEVGRVCRRDCVVGHVGPVSPAVQNAKNHGASLVSLVANHEDILKTRSLVYRKMAQHW